MSLLLMTATIDSGYFGNTCTKLTDTQERLKQYREALHFYIKESNFDKIVFAENSSSAFEVDYFTKLAKQNSKSFEYLPVQGDIEKTKTLGKSYGEAKIIQDFIEKSQLLGGESSFYKITGRLIVRNINQFVNEKAETRIISQNSYSACVTSFFKLAIEDYWKWFHEGLKGIDEFHGMNIEHAVYRQIDKMQIGVKSFRPYPDISGVIAGTGGKYDKGRRKLRLFSFLSYCGFFDYHHTEASTKKRIAGIHEKYLRHNG